ALGVDAAHLVGREPGQLGDRLPQRPDALAVGPDGERAVLEEGHGARRADRAVQQEGAGGAGGGAGGGGPAPRGAAAGRGGGGGGEGGGGEGAEAGVDIAGGQRRAGPRPAAGLQLAQRLDGRPLLLGDHGGEAAIADDGDDAGPPRDGLEVRIGQRRAVAGA